MRTVARRIICCGGLCFDCGRRRSARHRMSAPREPPSSLRAPAADLGLNPRVPASNLMGGPCSLYAQPAPNARRNLSRTARVNRAVVEQREGAPMTKSDDHAIVDDLQDWLRELHELRRRALAQHDAARAAELQAEIEELSEALEFDRAGT
jgi:hypothetical protein